MCLLCSQYASGQSLFLSEWFTSVGNTASAVPLSLATPALPQSLALTPQAAPITGPAAAYVGVVQRFYLAYFGRPADTGGLTNFTASLAASGAPTGTQALLNTYSSNAAVRNLVDTFGASAESRTLYAGTTALDQVSSIYLNVLNRAGDASGLAYWSGEVSSGRLPLSLVALAIEAAAETTPDAGIVNLKTAIASSFTTNLDLPSEEAGYYGNAAAASVRNLLRTVSTSDTVAGFDARVQSSITGLVNAANGLTLTGTGVLEGNSGATNLPFTLTLDRPASAPITVNVATQTTGTAAAGQDFTPLSQAVTFAVGQISATVNVQVIGDLAFEPNESVNLLATSTDARLTGSWQAQGTIVNDDAQVSAAVAAAQSRSNVNVGVGQTATLATQYVTALQSGASWNKQALTFSFNTNDPGTGVVSGWLPFTEQERSAARQTFEILGSFLGLQFTEVASGGDIRFNQGDLVGGLAGTADFPFNGLPRQIFLDTRTSSTPGQFGLGGYGNFVLAHEIGHSLGLKHPSDGAINLPSGLNNSTHSVMTSNTTGVFLPVFSVVGSTIGVTNALLASSYTALDIQALQAFYGGNLNSNTGNNTYRVDVSRGQTLAIWDAGGTDAIDASDAIGASTIDLRPGTFSSVNVLSQQQRIDQAVATWVSQGGNAQQSLAFATSLYNSANSFTQTLYTGVDNLSIVTGSIVENVTTGAGNDTVIDNAVNNAISTGAGNDVIQLGNGGFDTIDGGAGQDTVVIGVLQASVQRSTEPNGHIIIVGSSFSADLVGIERIQFNDALVIL